MTETTSKRALLLDSIERIEIELADARESYTKAQERARPINEAASKALDRVLNREDDLRKAKIELARLLGIGANGSALSVGVDFMMSHNERKVTTPTAEAERSAGNGCSTKDGKR